MLEKEALPLVDMLCRMLVDMLCPYDGLSYGLPGNLLAADKVFNRFLKIKTEPLHYNFSCSIFLADLNVAKHIIILISTF